MRSCVYVSYLLINMRVWLYIFIYANMYLCMCICIHIYTNKPFFRCSVLRHDPLQVFLVTVSNHLQLRHHIETGQRQAQQSSTQNRNEAGGIVSRIYALGGPRCLMFRDSSPIKSPSVSTLISVFISIFSMNISIYIHISKHPYLY